METEVMNQEEKVEINSLVVTEERKELGESKADQIEAVFAPYMKQLKVYKNDYLELIEESKKGITEELGKKAHRLKLDIGKQRIDSNKDRKAYKKGVDLYIKVINGTNHKVELFANEMETNLDDIVKHQERIEAELKEALAIERIEELKKYECDGEKLGLGEMNETIWKNFLAGTKLNYETVKEAERKAEADRVENDRKEKLNTSRRLQCSRLVDFIPDFATRDLSDLSEDEYKVTTTEAIRMRTIKEDEQEAIRKENENLKIEADKKDALQKKKETARKAKEKKDADAREAEKLRIEKENQTKLDKEKRIADEKLDKERKEKAKLQKKIDDEKALQDKIKKEEDKRIRDAELAPDKEKLKTVLINLDSLRGKMATKIATDALSKAYAVLKEAIKQLEGEPDWISIECPSCGKVDNYTQTVSGTTPCSKKGCHKLLKVGKIGGIVE